MWHTLIAQSAARALHCRCTL